MSPRSSFVVGVALLVFTSCAGSSHVNGHVTKLEDGPLSGAHVTIDGLKTHEEIVTDAAGQFDFTGLGPGTYRLKAELPGFVTEMRKDVDVARGATAMADFVLHPACLEEGSYVDDGLAWALQVAQAIVHVRIDGAAAPDRWIINDQCVVGMDHTGTVLNILNMDRDSASMERTIHIVKDGRTPYARGDEYVAFLRWEPAIGRYRPVAGPVFMIPVHGGNVAWTRTDASNIHDGESVLQVLTRLYALLTSARGAR